MPCHVSSTTTHGRVSHRYRVGKLPGGLNRPPLIRAPSPLRGSYRDPGSAYCCETDEYPEGPLVRRHQPRRVPPVGGPRETAAAGPPSKSIQPTIASATVNSLSSPQFAQFASNCVSENRGVGGSTPPLTTSPNSGRQQCFFSQIRHFGALSFIGSRGRVCPNLCQLWWTRDLAVLWITRSGRWRPA
jgi:hypothetical protein